VAHFCSGHVYFVQKLQDYLKIKPYAVHATFQFSGTPGKKHRFREEQLWDEKHEYFQKLGKANGPHCHSCHSHAATLFLVVPRWERAGNCVKWSGWHM